MPKATTAVAVIFFLTISQDICSVDSVPEFTINLIFAALGVTVATGVNHLDFGLLRGGDTNGDNYVTLLDFSILDSTFGKCTSTTGYDSRADFTGDGCIQSADPRD